MATTMDLGESEVSDDSISLTSTVESEQKDNYEVECILAERRFSKGVMKYLTKWKGYREIHNTWEPRENFDMDDTLNDWENAKIRIAEGLEQPFNVKAWEKRCRVIEEQASTRKERRRLKKLQFTKEERLASRLGDQDVNIGSSASKSSLKRSDKQIKRRNVHQESPPSSSASASSSSLTSEDSDRPLVSRQESGSSTPTIRWTEEETIALVDGLKILKGPRWTELLAMYGRSGTKSQVLKDRNPTELYDKAKSVRQEFIDSGREPPDYLMPFSGLDFDRGSRTARLTSRTESRLQSRDVSKSSSRSTSADSLMAELQEKQRTRMAKNRGSNQVLQDTNSRESLDTAGGHAKQSDTAKDISSDRSKTRKSPQASPRRVGPAFANMIPRETPHAVQPDFSSKRASPQKNGLPDARESSKDELHRGELAESGLRVAKLPQKPAVSEPGSKISNTKGTVKPDSTAVAPSESSVNGALENNSTVRGETARNTWSGTARTSTARPSISASGRQDVVASAPTRPGFSKLKAEPGQIEPKRPSVKGDITAGWNAEPKRRKSNNWAATTVDPVDGQSGKPNWKLSVQNRVYKSRRDGRAPDPKYLDLIDPKTGKAPPAISTLSANSIAPKTPLLLHQEQLAAEEAAEHRAQEAKDATRSSPTKRHPPPQSTDYTQEITTEEQTVPKTGGLPMKASASAVSHTIAGTTDGPARIDTLKTSSSASYRGEPPSNAPHEPKIETSRIAAISPRENTKHPKTSTNQLSEAKTDSVRPLLSSGPTMFTLRAYPSKEQETEILCQNQPYKVIGEIRLKENDEEEIKVKFVGFGFEVHKLLLTIKVFPRSVDFVFNSVCLASEYAAYFPAEPSDYLGSGSVVALNAHSAPALEDIVENLANTLQGGLFFAQQFTMLIYPAGASVWAFLDDSLPTVYPGTTLRFLVRKPLPPAPADADEVATGQLIKTGPEQYAQLKSRIQKYPIQAEDKNINIVFRDMFDIDFERLVAQNGPQQHPPTNIFFLCFIPQGCEDYEPDLAKRSDLRMRASEEHDLFTRFLQENGAEEIYSMQNIGSQKIDNNAAWDYFLKNVKSGTIIFHDTFIRYDLVPRLAKHLLHGSVNVWKTSLSPMDPGEKHPHLVRLFPHGGVLLLTESLILYRPREALRILMWFRLVHIPAKAPGTWKLAVRPRVREWLLDLMDAYSSSGKDIFNCSMQTFADIYTEIYRLLQRPNPNNTSLMCQTWDHEIPLDEAPIVSSSSLRVLQSRREWAGEGAATEPNDAHIRQNDDLLIQWFAEWAVVNLQSFRKFHAILGYGKDHPFTDTAVRAYEKAWGHIEVMTFDEAFTRHKVTVQLRLDDLEADRRRKQKEQRAPSTATSKAAASSSSALEARM